eukprot:GHVU01069190.1.p7 GENE.GHVU01069190.1~~GHVU01069190.1.p7  ORF type:complete len:101 (-),score=5.77 GHVU01069190.1:401-703(-)
MPQCVCGDTGLLREHTPFSVVAGMWEAHCQQPIDTHPPHTRRQEHPHANPSNKANRRTCTHTYTQTHWYKHTRRDAHRVEGTGTTCRSPSASSFECAASA